MFALAVLCTANPSLCVGSIEPAHSERAGCSSIASGEAGKLCAVAWLGRFGGSPTLRAALIVLVAVLMVLDGAPNGKTVRSLVHDPGRLQLARDDHSVT